MSVAITVNGCIKGKAYTHLLQLLHIFYASLFAFVLPFICWGMQGTLEHTHASTHFVFVEPLVGEIESVAHVSLEQQPNDHQPTGRSVPAVIVITLLIFFAVAKVLVRFNPRQPHFYYWLSQPHPSSFCVPILTPPPR